jgi:hypothetical protein
MTKHVCTCDVGVASMYVCQCSLPPTPTTRTVRRTHTPRTHIISLDQGPDAAADASTRGHHRRRQRRGGAQPVRACLAACVRACLSVSMCACVICVCNCGCGCVCMQCAICCLLDRPLLSSHPQTAPCPADRFNAPHKPSYTTPPDTQAAAAGGRGGDVDEADPPCAEAGPGDALEAGEVFFGGGGWVFYIYVCMCVCV